MGRNSVLAELKNVSKNFESLEVLKGINLKIQEGQKTAILGPSGSGKSTLLHILGLMESPSSGSMTLNDHEINQRHDHLNAKFRLQFIGFLFQFHYLLEEFDVFENTLMPARIARDDLGEAGDRALSLLDRLGIKDRRHHRPSQISGGEQQRAALARALLRKPKLLLCDEPTGNLDVRTARGMLDLLWSEAETENCSVVIATHNEQLVERVEFSYYLHEGKLTLKQI